MELVLDWLSRQQRRIVPRLPESITAFSTTALLNFHSLLPSVVLSDTNASVGSDVPLKLRVQEKIDPETNVPCFRMGLRR